MSARRTAAERFKGLKRELMHIQIMALDEEEPGIESKCGEMLSIHDAQPATQYIEVSEA